MAKKAKIRALGRRLTDIETLSKQIKKSNKALVEATPAEKRVLIAKDVIKAIKDNKIEATKGIYFSPDTPLAINNYKGDTQYNKLLKKMPSCQVCARGAIFVCAVTRFNHLSIDQVRPHMLGESSTPKSGGFSLVSQVDKEYFSRGQIDLIERSFEGSEAGLSGSLSDSNHEKACSFYRQYWRNAEERMIAIMQNIIDNKGTFKPETSLVEQEV